MTKIGTEYANTDFDLKSKSSFDTLHQELSSRCCVLHYWQNKDGHYSASFESDHDGTSSDTGAARDIRLIVSAIKQLSEAGKVEFDACYLREFNIGFHCGDNWAFVHSVPHHVLAAVSEVGCSLAVTLYPMRNSDGSIRV